MQEPLEAERIRTTRRIDALRRELDSLTEPLASATTDDEHDPDATGAFERAQIQGLLAGARADLAELDAADERLRAGTYGWCEACTRPIGAERLAALPAARTCIGCAS